QQEKPQRELGPLPGVGNDNVRYVNDKEILIDFEIAKQGKSGVQKIEVWWTRDPKVQWNFHHTEVNPKSPLAVKMDAEGRYGITPVGISGVGEAVERPSVAKDQPQMWFEVDTTPPKVSLEGMPEVKLVGEDGRMLIRWSASDKNLAANPVSLSYAVD